MLCIIDEFSRESLMIRVARKLVSQDRFEILPLDSPSERDF